MICVRCSRIFHEFKVEHTDSKCDCLNKSQIYRLILCNIFFNMTHVLQLISAQNCDKNVLQNRRGMPVFNKIGSLTIFFSVFSFAKICQCTQFLPIHIYTIIKAKMKKISSDTHQLQLFKLHHFKLEIFKSI